MTPIQFYWEFTPAEFHWALADFRETQDYVYHGTCETLRNVAVIIHNSAFGRKRSDQVDQPRKLWTFPWEKDLKTERKSDDEIKEFMLGLAHLKGVTVTTNKDRQHNGR